MLKGKYHNLFLARVYRQSKPLFWAMVVFILGQGFFTWKGVDTMPFYNWGMYSGRYPDKAQYEVLYIQLDNRYVPLTKLPTTKLKLVEYFQSPSLPNRTKLSRTKSNVVEHAIRYYLLMEEAGFRDGMDGVIESRFKGRLGNNAYLYVYHRLSNTGMQKRDFDGWMFRQMRRQANDSFWGPYFAEVGHFTISYIPEGIVIQDTIPRFRFE